MKWFLAILALVLLSQVLLFIFGRKYRRSQRKSVIERYNLRSPKDAWDAMADPNTPETDREEIRRLYEARDD